MGVVLFVMGMLRSCASLLQTIDFFLPAQADFALSLPYSSVYPGGCWKASASGMRERAQSSFTLRQKSRSSIASSSSDISESGS
jgi:hypothetical protein